MQPAVKPCENKLIGLEGLRFLTAFAILVFHYRHFTFVADKPVGLSMQRLPLYGWLHPFYDSGAFGVWVFWCISGFIFFWKYRDAISGRGIGGWQFFTLRLSRLYPLHLVMLLLVALLQSIYFNLRGCFFVYPNNGLSHFLAQLFMASEWGFTPGYSFDGPVWSVSVEVLVYFLFFLMLRATCSWLLNIVIVVACLAAAFGNTGGQVISCLALFYAGGLAAMARRAADASRFRRRIGACAWFAVLVVLPLVVYLVRDQLDRIDLPLFVVGTPILLFCLSREISMPRVVQAAIAAAGNMTYSSYLMHFPLQLAIVLCFAAARRPVPVYDGALFAVYLLAVLLLSYVTFRFFEAPAQDFIRSAFLGAREPLRRASST